VDQPSFMKFVRFTNQSRSNMRVFAQPMGGSIRSWLVIDVEHSSGELLAKDVICASASIRFREQPNEFASQIGLGSGDVQRVPDPYCGRQNGDVDLSGPFDCLGEISIEENGREADFDSAAGKVWPLMTPALLLDAAWRVAAVKASEDDALFVPVQVDRLILPIRPNFDSASPWKIRSAKPTKDGNDVRWARTEAIDPTGAVRLVVENGFAKRLT